MDLKIKAMEYNPKVTISIPTYNQESRISRAIQSVLNQTYKNIQINICDDYSTDNTFEICQEFKMYPNISIFRNKENIGRIKNYMKLFYELSGNTDWVVNLDGDDYFTNENFIKDGIDHIKKYKDDNDPIVLYHSQLDIKPFREQHLKKINTTTFLISGKDYFIKRPLVGNWLHLSAMVSKAHAATLPFYKFTSLNNDALSIRLLSLEGNVIVNNDKVGFWDCNPNSETKKTNQEIEIKRFRESENKFRKLSKLKLNEKDYEAFLNNLNLAEEFHKIINYIDSFEFFTAFFIYIKNRRLQKYYSKSILYHIKRKVSIEGKR